MPFFRSRLRDEVAQLSKQVQALTAHVTSQPQAPQFDFSNFIGTAMDSQAKQMGATGDFIRMLHELALERMASVMGRRGGRKRAASADRDSRGRMLPARKRPAEGDCVLCDDPQAADFSVADFQKHQSHKGRKRSNEVVDVTPAPANEVATMPERMPERHVEYPLPYVERPTDNGDRNEGSFHSGQEESNGIDKTHIH